MGKAREVKTVVIPNSIDGDYKTIKKPQVLLVWADNCDVILALELVAEDTKELDLMWERKVYYTSSIITDETLKLGGATFHGVDPKREAV
jgi:hypothetical protein